MCRPPFVVILCAVRIVGQAACFAASRLQPKVPIYNQDGASATAGRWAAVMCSLWNSVPISRSRIEMCTTPTYYGPLGAVGVLCRARTE